MALAKYAEEIQEAIYERMAMRERKNAAVSEDTTAVNDDPAKHTEAEQRVIEEYKDAVDPALVAFYEQSKGETVAKKGAKPFEMRPISERATEDIADGKTPVGKNNGGVAQQTADVQTPQPNGRTAPVVTTPTNSISRTDAKSQGKNSSGELTVEAAKDLVAIEQDHRRQGKLTGRVQSGVRCVEREKQASFPDRNNVRNPPIAWSGKP